MVDDVQVREVRYYQIVKPPTLAQFLHRRYVGLIMSQVKGDGAGVVFDDEKGLPRPKSALWAREKLKGVTSDRLAREHPEWVEEYNASQGGAK